MTLLVGADRSQLRCVLVDGETLVGEQTFEAEARGRNEQVLIEAFLANSATRWQDLGHLVALETPTNSTSVRVVQTILATAGWYAGTPMQSLAVPDLALPSTKLLEALSAK